MLDIDDHAEDAYLSDFTERRAKGIASPLDRANTALLNASQVVTLLSEEDDTIKAEAHSKLERVATAAAAVAIAERQEDNRLAAEFAQVAESEALVLDSFDYSKVDGLTRHKVHSL